MNFEYEKPIVEIVTFVSATRLAREDDGDRTRTTTDGDNTDIPKVSIDEGVGDW